jgi:hypothetical protein
MANDELLSHDDHYGLAAVNCPDFTFERQTGILVSSERVPPPAALKFIEILPRLCEGVARI